MFRMSVIALAAAAALGTTVLTPTAASADWHGWRHRDAIEDRFEHRDRIKARLERRERFEPIAADVEAAKAFVREFVSR